MNSHVLYLIAGKDDAIGDVPTLPMPSKIRANIGFQWGRIVLIDHFWEYVRFTANRTYPME